MADIYIVVFSVIGMLISFPGLMAALNLLLPKVTESAYLRLAHTPVKSFMLGLPVSAVFTLWILITANIKVGPVQALAFIAALIWMALASLGAAGIARLMGERIDALNQHASGLANILRGAVIYQLACLFPLIGWFVFWPIASITVTGAAIFGLLHWVPKPKSIASPPAEMNLFAPLETHS
jgi:hypothetical protein